MVASGTYCGIVFRGWEEGKDCRMGWQGVWGTWIVSIDREVRCFYVRCVGFGRPVYPGAVVVL